MKQYFITNAIPYVNDKPHVGHALEFVQTDAHARYKKLKGFDVLTLCGGDENAMKNVQAAEKAGREIQPFIDENTQLFLDLSKALNVHFDVWQRGSNTKTHFPSSQKLWELCDKNGDIYKKSYEGLYCVGCELFYTADELDENGECFEHPGKKLESVSEENYFFKLSKYTDQIRELIQSDKLKIIPEIRKNEMLAFLKEPLQDISISRSNERAKNWGVPVPNDPTQRMYVWFDALNIYQSGIGFGWDDEMYKKWWPAQVHVIGKGINRFHTIYWPAFLISAGLELPKSVFVHGYFTVDGLKMSKTVGNVVDPLPIIEEYGIDALRYYFLREISAYGDGDFSVRRLIELYNADLANGLGNLVSRIAKLCEGLDGVKAGAIEPDFLPEVESAMEIFKFDEAVEAVWKRVRGLDKYLNENEPWRIKDDPQKKTEIMQHAVNELLTIGFNLQPFLPQTAEKMLKQFGGIEIKVQEPYFLRK